MKPIIAVVFLLVVQQRCDLRSMASPEAIQGQIEAKLQPQFPNVRSIAIPSSHAILALSCVQGTGPEFVRMVFDSLAHDAHQLQALNQVKILPLIGGARYDYFVLVFDSGWIWYNINAHTIDIRDMPDAALALYKQQCGFAQ